MNNGNLYFDKLLKLFLTLEEKNIALAFNMANSLQLDFDAFLVERYAGVIEMHGVNMTQSNERIIGDFIQKLQSWGNDWIILDNKVTELPDEIGDFTYLTELQIYGDPLKYIPDGIYRLKNLVTLEIKRSVEGTLSADLYNLQKLNKLDFSGKITHVEEGISQLTHLEHLDLTFADNVPFPEEICKLSNLDWLVVSGSNFEHIPDEISDLQRLGYLGIIDSGLKKIPKEIFTLSQLRVLNLSENNLTEISSEIAQFTQLKSIIINDNAIDKLPEELGQLSDNMTFSLASNRIETLPVSLNQRPIESLMLPKNRVNPCKINKEFWSNQIVHFVLSENGITQLPIEIKNMKKLRMLNLGHNDLQEFPVEVIEIPMLKGLSLAGNPFNSIPDQICGMTLLKDLNISKKHYDGSSALVKKFLSGINVEFREDKDFDLFIMSIFS